MVAVPAWVWQFGPLIRALIVGPAVGLVIGLLAAFGSDSVVAGLVAFVVATLVYGALMARRMAKFWPESKRLNGSERAAVAGAARGGRDIGDPRLAAGVVQYNRALREAAGRFWLWWWLVALLGVVALGVAIMDTLFAPAREAVVSWLYFAFFPVEAWWWPRRQARILANAERAAQLAT